jgi:cysteine desulfurase
MLHYLEAREIYISSGSACGKGAKSHVLTAMGMPQDIIDSALRISFSRYNTNEDIERLYEGIIAGNMELVHRSVV